MTINLHMRVPAAFWTAGLIGVVCASTASGQVERFKPKLGEAIGVWRVRHDPAVRDYHNYHNTQCWSPDGRYVCFTHFAADDCEYGPDRAAEIYRSDLAQHRPGRRRWLRGFRKNPGGSLLATTSSVGSRTTVGMYAFLVMLLSREFTATARTDLPLPLTAEARHQ